ncbi:MAG: hypothetical protein ACREDV_03950 [Methylocella sp.]
MFGFSLEALNSWTNVIYLVAVAVAAVASVAIYQLSARISAQKDAELAQFREKSQIDITFAQVESAKANERAAMLEKEAEELRKKNLDMEAAVSPRILEQRFTAEALKPFSDMSFVVVSPSDFEPKRTAGQIRFMLLKAGWKKVTENISTFPFPFFDGVTVHPISKMDRSRELDAANALVSILIQNNIAARVGYPQPKVDAQGHPVLPLPSPQGAEATDAILIEVGPKPLPPSLRLNPENIPADPIGIKIWGNIAE